MAEASKSCPGCAQTIKSAALICRFCGFDFRSGQPGATPAAPRPGLSGKVVALIVVIVLAVVGLPIVAIIAAIAIPSLIGAQRASLERNAAACLRTLTTAEAVFRSNDSDRNEKNDYWTGDVSQLHYMRQGESKLDLIQKPVADADASPQGPTQKAAKSGYWFVAIKLDERGGAYDQGEGRNWNKFAFCTYPETYGSGGRSTFIVNEDCSIWKKDTGGAPVTQFPANPAMEGWQRLD